jgi:type IV secretory pathway TrbF-like protein
MATSSAPHPIFDASAMTRHNDRFLQQEQRLRGWQLTTWWLCALATVLVVTNCTQWLTRKEHYGLVQLDGIGVSRYVGEMSAVHAQSLPIKLLLVQQFIRGIRTVSTDQHFQENQMNAAYFLCREKAQSFLREYFARPENDPKTLQKQGISKIPVTIDVAPQTETTFTASWTEDVQDVTGLKRTRWTGTVTLELKDPETLDSAERAQSPFGIFITYVNFSRMGKVDG